ncbi:MAG: hypothetical protein WC444_06965 [Candidatus Paceibacterota bacterium]
MRYKQKENPHIIQVHSFEEFLRAIAKYNNKEEMCCVYAGVNPYKTWRLNENVTHLKQLFFDIDCTTQEEFDEIQKHAEELGMRWSKHINSGRGKYLLFPVTPTEITDTNRDDIYNLTASLVDYFNEKFKALDARCKDVSRISRVWGTVHYKNVIEHKGSPLQCQIIAEQEVSPEQMSKNLEVAQGIAAGRKHEYKLFNDNTVGECYACDSVLENPLPPTVNNGESSTGFNDRLGKNLAIYACRLHGRNGLEMVRKCYSSRDKNPKEADGWFKKAEGDPDFKLNCYEIKNYLEENYPTVFSTQCKRCMREKRNRIIYTDEPDAMRELKEKYKGRLKFFIADKEMFDGIVSPSEQGDAKQLYIIGNIYQRNNGRANRNFQRVLNMEDIENNNSNFEMFYFGEPLPGRNREVVRYERAGFYRYELKEGDRNYILLSEKKIPYGENIIRGMITEVNGKYTIAEGVSLRGTQQVVFVFDHKPKLAEVNNDDELFKLVDFTEQELIDTIYSKLDGNRLVTFRQPAFINTLVLSWLFSGKKNYPLHVNIVGQPHCGKTELLERLSELMNEEIMDCGGSTIKSLIPSFHGIAPEIGALFRSRRVCMLDELINMLARTGKKSEETSDMFITANNILEHKKNHKFGSGKGNIMMSMHSKVIAVNNPATGKTIKETFKIMPEAFMDRFLPVRFSSNYKLYVSSGNYVEDKAKTIKKFTFLSITDYLNNFMVDIDKKRYDECLKEIKPLVPEEIQFFFSSRTSSHHMQLILDGIIKVRCLLEKDSSWVATERDYAKFTNWLRDWVRWWWDDKLPQGKTITRVLNDEQKIILELVGNGLGRIKLFKLLEERNIEAKYNLKFLYDNGVLSNDENNIFPLINTNESEVSIEDMDVRI